MTEAWRPFTDEEMRRIIEGEKVNGSSRQDCLSHSVKKVNHQRMRITKNYQRTLENRSKLGAIKLCDTNGLNQRIPKIPEEKEEEDDLETVPIEEPILRSESIEVRKSPPSLDANYNNNQLDERHHFQLDDAALDRFQQRQAEMESKNKANQLLLQQALSTRAKKTREEAEKLNRIEVELKKLDQMLSNDVTIIRHQIEVASHEYMEAQKRYDRAEKEYIATKMDLFQHRERKDLLTAHLCTIIERNEMRKAEKLSALMMKLEMGADIDSLTLSEGDLNPDGRINPGFQECSEIENLDVLVEK